MPAGSIYISFCTLICIGQMLLKEVFALTPLAIAKIRFSGILFELIVISLIGIKLFTDK